MIFFVRNDGTIVKNLPSAVYQGGEDAGTIYLIAPFPASAEVMAAFKLGNGAYEEVRGLTKLNEIPGAVNQATGAPYSGWSFSLYEELSRYYGTVEVQFFFMLSKKVIPTSKTSFSVGKGVPVTPPQTPTADVYADILHNLASIQEQLNNGAFKARSVNQWNAYPVEGGEQTEPAYGINEIVFYPDIGVYGAFVKSTHDNNINNVPYINGELNSEHWAEVINFNKVPIEGMESVNKLVIEATKQAGLAAESASAAAGSAANADTAANRAEEAADNAYQKVLDNVEHFKGDTGDSVFIRYSASPDGANMTEVWQPTQRYIGLYVGQTAPETADGYQWRMFIGEFIPADDSVTTQIEYELENGVDKTFKAENIESFKIIIPANVAHGFSTVINILSGDNPVTVLTAQNNSNYPLVYLRRGFPTTQFTSLAKNAITKLAIECDGINVNCFFVEFER